MYVYIYVCVCVYIYIVCVCVCVCVCRLILSYYLTNSLTLSVCPPSAALQLCMHK